ncbi:MAG: MFS transporter [Pseudomonadota bacterium]
MTPSSPTPWTALIVLMTAGLAFSTGAFVFGGLLTPMAADLGVSVAAVAQLQAVFALACAVGGPSLAIALRRVDRKRLLVAVMLVLAAVNAASATMSSYGGLVALRIGGGFVGALTLPLASALAVSLVAEAQRGRALATVSAGTAFSLLIGIPLGSVIGDAYGWRAAFWMAAVLPVLVAGLISALVPGPEAGGPPPEAKGVFGAPLPLLYACTLLAFVATFASVGLIERLIITLTGARGAGLGAMQALVGIGSLLGLAAGARLAERVGTRSLLPLFAVIAICQAIYAGALYAGVSGSVGIAAFALGTIPGAAALFATFPVIYAGIAARAGAAATLAFAINGATIFLGQGLGVALGSVTFAALGLWPVGVVGAAVGLIGLGIARRLRASA